MEYARSFDHRGGKTSVAFGHIGAVTFTVPDGEYRLNGAVLPESSVRHLLETYALQSLQDAYAGAKSTDEALGSFNKRLDALLNGTMGVRGSGDGADYRTIVMRSVVGVTASAKFGPKSPEWLAFLELEDDERNAKLAAWYEANKETFDPAIDEEIERRAAKKAAKEALRGSVAIEM